MTEPSPTGEDEGYEACDDEVAKVLVIVVAKSAQLRFRLGRKLRSLPCSSSPHKAIGRFCGGPICFPSLRIGNRLVVPKEEFIRWVERRT